MISKEEIKHIASLARLELTGSKGDPEEEKMQKDLSAILDYFNLLKKAPKPKKSASLKGGDLRCARKDEVVSSYNTRDELIGAAPDKQDDYIRVKNIF